MSRIIWNENYQINSFLVNPEKQLGLYSLLNLLQDTAWLHAEELGFGYEATMMKKSFWVLTRQNLVMDSWPQWGQSIQIQTWIRQSDKTMTVREFEISCNGIKLGECATSWILLDQETRKPIRNGIESFSIEGRREGWLHLETTKIEITSDLETLTEFQVRNSDLDMHHHVNNTRYAQWILDSIPISWHSRFRLHQYEINFLAETKSNDRISIQKSKEPVKINGGSSAYLFTGLRSQDQKLVFAARLHISEKKES